QQTTGPVVYGADARADGGDGVWRPGAFERLGDTDLCGRRTERRVGTVRREADLAILRTGAKIPVRARAVAILEHDPILLLSHGAKKIKSFDDLKKQKKIAL